MLTFCDPTAAAVADMTAFTPTRIVARYSGTVAELFADFNTGTPDRTVHARPLVGLSRPAAPLSAGTPPPPTTAGTSPPATSGARYRTNRRGPSPTSTATTASWC